MIEYTVWESIPHVCSANIMKYIYVNKWLINYILTTMPGSNMLSKKTASETDQKMLR